VISATGYATKAGRCDRSHRVRLSVSLGQTWSTARGSTDTRRSYEGPAVQTLTQYNSGTPARLADAAFPFALFDPSFTISGRFYIGAHASSGSENFSYRYQFTLNPDTR
jgi:hypothetical protein